MIRILFVVLAMLAVPIASYAKGADLILKSANTNLNTMVKGDIITVLEGNVVFLYEDATIRSDYARWYKSQGTVSFSNHVVVTQLKKTLKCNQLDYDKNKKWLNARGNVEFYDAGQPVYCIYVAIGQKASTVAGVMKVLTDTGAMAYTTIVLASASDPARLPEEAGPDTGCRRSRWRHSGY